MHAKLQSQDIIMSHLYSHLSMLAMQNLGLAVFIIVADSIKENFGYIYLEITFLIVLYLAFLAGM